ncbi:hypothetical protein N8T08_001717 [Aspergillus melleus]|uniref:Uncharacterized protein n=1 Tax=Aspergillus melleus TaxID=138277 RepID=A0ACC3AMS2_9EURO|nr:hypothetical protein N8T08_001717 [Aspergillus melleus]
MGSEYFEKKSIVSFLRLLVRMHTPVDPHRDEVLAVPSRDPDRTIKVHLYRDPQAADTAEPAPSVVNFCGSGFTLRYFGTDDDYCHYISRRTGRTVLDVKYRLAPENPFKAAFDDAEDVVSWRRRNLALAVVSSSPLFMAAHDPNASGGFHSVLAFYAPMNLSQPTPEKPQIDDRNLIMRKIFPHISHFCHKCLNPQELDTTDPRLSPIFADPNNFPSKVLIVTAAQDPFAAEGEELAEKLRKVEGRRVICQRMERCPHGWDKKAKEGTPQGDAKREAYDLAVEILRS